jgi:hypothetical protein
MAKMSNEKVDLFLDQLEILRISEYLGANIPMECQCKKCGKTFKPRLSNLKSSGRGHECVQWNSITSEMAREELSVRGFEMIGEFKGAKTKTESRCITCGKISFPTISNLRRNPKQGCIYCKKLLVDPADGKKFLEDSGFNLIGEWINASTLIEAICKRCNRKIRICYSEVKLGHGCAKCAGKLVDQDEAENIMKFAGYIPQVPYPGSGKKWKSIHSLCGREVSPVYGNILAGRGGCSFCAKYGFDNSKKSYLYFISHDELKAFKIGIANIPKLKKFDRVHRYRNQGWQLIKIQYFEQGEDARAVEYEIFQVIRKIMRIPQHLNKELMKKYNGHTETFSSDSIEVSEVLKIIEQVQSSRKKVKPH